MDAQTNTVHLCFVTRGHIDDITKPIVMASDEAFNFCRDVIKMDAWDILRKFELYTCSDREGTSSMPPATM